MKKSTVTTGRDSDKFMLRFPDGMRESIAVLAKSGGRSMNSEIVCRLQRTLNEDTQQAGDDAIARLAGLGNDPQTLTLSRDDLTYLAKEVAKEVLIQMCNEKSK